MLSNKDIDTLLFYLDRGIRAEIRRICNLPDAPLPFERLVTDEDLAIAKSMGILF